MMQSYAATASVQNDRSRAIAIVTGGVSLGLCLGPGEFLV
jgi:predicted MFS family arabinose efflux permease